MQGLFSPHSVWIGGRTGERQEKACPDCISEIVRCKVLLQGRDIGCGCRCASLWCTLDFTFDLVLVTLSLKILFRFFSETVRCRNLMVGRDTGRGIRSHLDSHDLGNTIQSAYKLGHSTETALLCIKNEIHLSLSKGMPTALVLLELSAAFDPIDHDTLLSCLSSRFGFAGSALKWFRSCLQDHFQSVKIGSSLSNLFKLKFGVPQGSVLGPLLFSLYTTPLGQVIRKYTGVRYHFYADDTQLFIHLSPDDSLKSFDRLKSCLNDIRVWMSENKLQLNPDKTEFIVFGAKDRHKWLSDSFPVNILGNCLSPADVVCNLGVLFDAKFCFTNHVNSVIKSCFISLRDLDRIRRFLSVDTSVVIAKALVSSRLDYCNSLLRNLSSRNATRLQYVQNALARFVTGASKYTHIHP